MATLKKELRLTRPDKAELKKLLIQDGHPIFDMAWLDMSCINVLPQVRKVFKEEALDILATDIANKSLINNPNVIFYEEKMARLHVKAINTLHGSDYDFNDLVECEWKGKKGYLILIAGERRFRSMNILSHKGCLTCRKKFAKDIKQKGAFEVCYKKHFGPNRSEIVDKPQIQVKVTSNISPFKALTIQISENLYEPPSSHEEAHMHAGLYKLLKLINPKYDIPKYCRRVSRPIATMRMMIGYCDLPIKIQRYVEEGHVRYGITKQLVRLRAELSNLGWKQPQIKRKVNEYFTRAVVGRHKVSRFTKMISSFLIEEKTGQQKFAFFQEKGVTMRPQYNVVADKKLQTSLRTENVYIQGITKLFQDGFLKGEDEILSHPEAQKMLVALCDAQENLLSQFGKNLDKESLAQLQGLVSKAKEIGLVV